jgi:ATP-dependent DNA helicase RecG
VVEVGVDVPNATVMMIEGAERFGLAQLHQFRGRVGRGAAKSYCLVLTDDPSEIVAARLSLMTRLSDGFRLAEADMNMRGVGELMGPRQHGKLSDAAMRALAQPDFLNEVRQEAENIVRSDPGLENHPLLKANVAGRLELTSIS